MNDFIIVYNDELYHHGVKGMKWGVRKKYQKYPGSYTQRGAKRFNESLSEYERQNKRYKDVKSRKNKTTLETIKNGKKDTFTVHPSTVQEIKKQGKSEGIKVNEIKKATSKADVTNARLARTKAKKRLSNDYDHLKKDKLADKGKELYSKGKTIRGNNKVTNALATIGGLSLSAAAYLGNTKMLIESEKRSTLIRPGVVLGAIGATTIAAAMARKAQDWDRNRKLRAYYSHSSKR